VNSDGDNRLAVESYASLLAYLFPDQRNQKVSTMIINRRLTIRRILESGQIEGYPIHSVYRFEDAQTSNIRFAAFEDSQHDDIMGCDTAFCRNVVTLMVNGMRTAEGDQWIADDDENDQMILHALDY